MLSIFDFLRDLTFLSVLIKMILACICGAAVGIERSSKNRPAGFRTHVLVCMGSCAAALTGLYMVLVLELPADISRISAQVISGLGFIVAGTIIITQKLTVKGLTTAAGLWTTGIIGLAIGSGYIELALLGTGFTLFTETLLNHLGSFIRKNPLFSLEIVYKEKEALDNLLRMCKDNRLSITSLKIRTAKDEGADFVAIVQLRGFTNTEKLLSRIAKIDGIDSVILL